MSIRQPFAELILRGIKTFEYPGAPGTSVVGERFYIYAAKKPAAVGTSGIWSRDLAVRGTNTGGTPVPRWMIELGSRWG